VMWRPGFSARWTGVQIEVLDQGRTVVAVTGRRYLFHGTTRNGADGAFWICMQPELLP
jgi:hypothetical protein